MVVGASAVRYRDFVAGTVLGMGVLVVALAGFGYQITEAWRAPSAANVLRASLFVVIPLGVAWLVNRMLRPSDSRDEGRAQ
jgi:uncharacterized membrane protein YdjX (TVP38/TMEM64 family)